MNKRTFLKSLKYEERELAERITRLMREKKDIMAQIKRLQRDEERNRW